MPNYRYAIFVRARAPLCLWAVAVAMLPGVASRAQAPDRRSVGGDTLVSRHIVEISAEEIALSGAATADDLLRKLPLVTLQGQSKQDDWEGEGRVTMDLRNLGPERTLVLVNGRRFVPDGPDGPADLNNIPVHMVEKVEILLDGGSAIHGADALGGVINFVLKDDFQGFKTDVSGGFPVRGMRAPRP